MHELNMRYEARHHYDIEGAVAYRLVGDVDLAAQCVSRFGCSKINQ